MVRIFSGDTQRRFTGVVRPAGGTIGLALILAFSFERTTPSTRLFIITAALAGIPLAWWRARVAQRPTLA